MAEAILNQAWDDVADEVTAAIEKAVVPLLKKVVDDIYGSLLDAAHDYLRDNLTFNIASTVDAERRAAKGARELAERYKAERDQLRDLAIKAMGMVASAERETNWGDPTCGPTPSEELRAQFNTVDPHP